MIGPHAFTAHDKEPLHCGICWQYDKFYWHQFKDWDGKGSSFPPKVIDTTPVVVQFRNGQVHYGRAQTFGWAHNRDYPEVQIVKYWS